MKKNKTALLCWEQGKDLGKINHITRVGSLLIEQGYTVYMAVKDLSRARQFLDHPKLQLLQAPRFAPLIPHKAETTYCFSDVLFGLGYADFSMAWHVFNNWKMYIEKIQPDLIVEDYAPGARLSAHALGVPSLNIGTGWGQPCPQKFDLNYFGGVLPQASNDKQGLLLECFNKVYHKAGCAIISKLSDIYTSTRTLISSLKEIEVYGPRESASYIGPLIPLAKKSLPAIEPGQGKALFVYLKAYAAGTTQVLDALLEIEAEGFVYASGMSSEDIARYAKKGLNITTSPFNVEQVLPLVNAVICHAGIGLVCQSLIAGKPILLLPTYLEQSLTAQKVIKHGAGLFLDLTKNEAVLKIEALLNSSIFTERAQAFKAHYKSIDHEAQNQSIREAIASLAS